MVAPARNSRRTLLLLCLASAGWAFGFGLGAPLASLWLRDAGQSARIIGLNTSVYYFGIALAALATPWLMRRIGRSCVVAGIIVDALVTALFPWAESLPAWLALRFLGGMATALSLIPMETLVNQNAPPQRRARDFGFYAFSVALGVALGSLVGLPLYPFAPRLAFAVGGIVTLSAAMMAWLGWTSDCVGVEETKGEGSLLLRANGLSYGTAWVQGFLEGGLITFLSIYLLGLGYTESAVSFLVAGLFAGVILCQVPVACLADRLGRLRVLVGCQVLLLAVLACLPRCPGTATLSVCLFVLGTCCGALYPLGLALLGERVAPARLARANACYLASNCAGSLSGPVLFGLAIDRFGQPSQFLVGGAAVTAVFGLWMLGATGDRKSAPEAAASPSNEPLSARKIAG
jgi:MFS family permease